MRSLPRFCLFTGLLAALAPGPSRLLSGQSDSTAVLSGRVVDGAGEPIASATLQLLGTALRTESDSTGGFAFRDLPPGTYSLRANAAYHRPLTIDGLELLAGGARWELVSLQVSHGPITLRPVLGRSPGPEELALQAHLDARALQLGWPPLSDLAQATGVRELRLEFGGGMIYGPRTVVRLIATTDSTWGEFREVWWHSPESSGPYQVHPSPARSCMAVDSVTTRCTLSTGKVDWQALADSVARIGLWDRFIEVGVTRTFPSLSDQSTLIAEASIDGAYRSASYYSPDSFPDTQTQALVAVELLFHREVSKVLSPDRPR